MPYFFSRKKERHTSGTCQKCPYPPWRFRCRRKTPHDSRNTENIETAVIPGWICFAKKSRLLFRRQLFHSNEKCRRRYRCRSKKYRPPPKSVIQQAAGCRTRRKTQIVCCSGITQKFSPLIFPGCGGYPGSAERPAGSEGFGKRLREWIRHKTGKYLM